MRLFIVFFLLLQLTVFSSFAQQPDDDDKPSGTGTGSRNASGESGFGVLTGTLRDGKTGEFVEYGNVLAFRQSDSSMVAGTISDFKGRFLFKSLKSGNYFIRIQFIGYETKLIPGIIISDQRANIKLGDIAIMPKLSSLSAVEITADKSLVTNNLDKKVIAVDKSMAIGGGTATDVMENVPSVAVDAEGNISLRGNSNITLLIDGKPASQAGIAASDVLNQIPASAIENVEVITNPSVRYDPDGTSGIINIVLKKKALQGFNGMVSANAGTGDKYNGSLNLNYRMNKLNLFSSVDGRYNQMLSSMESTRTTTYDGVTTLLRQTQEGKMLRNMGSVSAGIDYMANTRNNVTLSIQNRTMEFGSDGTIHNSNYTDEDSLFRYFDRQVENTRKVNSTELTASYKHLFPQNGREYTNDFIYSENKMNNNSDIRQQDYIDQGQEPLGTPMLQRNNAVNSNRMYTLQGNYIYPVSSGARIEAGYKTAIRDMTMLYDYENFNDVSGEWENIPSLKNEYDYTDQLYAAYAIYGNSWKKLKYQAGLRFEHVLMDSKVAQTNDQYRSNYSSLYPSLHTEYEVGKNKQLQLSYSRRVERPSPRDLNPYVDYADSLNIETGNPALKPEYTNSVELGFMRFWTNSSLTSGLFFRNTSDVVEEISQLSGNGITITMPRNIASATSYGLELTGSANPVKWYKLNANFSFYRELMSAIPEFDIEGSDKYSWSTRLNMTFFPWKDGAFQLIANYNSPSRSVQEYHKARYYADASFRQDLLSGKLSLSLRLTDIFNTRTFYENTYGNGFYTESKRYRESRVLYAGIQFRINNYEKKTDKNSENGENNDQIED